MPFDEKKSEDFNFKKGLKQVSSQPSIFENMPPKPTQADLEQKVKQIQDSKGSYKARAADLGLRFMQLLSDKTIKSNKTIFSQEIEKDVLTQMIALGFEINQDQNESEGSGAMCWIVLLLKICLAQRDRLNQLEYSHTRLEQSFSQLEKKFNVWLDKNKISE